MASGKKEKDMVMASKKKKTVRFVKGYGSMTSNVVLVKAQKPMELLNVVSTKILNSQSHKKRKKCQFK